MHGKTFGGFVSDKGTGITILIINFKYFYVLISSVPISIYTSSRNTCLSAY